jgi:hypothetical protein
MCSHVIEVGRMLAVRIGIESGEVEFPTATLNKNGGNCLGFHSHKIITMRDEIRSRLKKARIGPFCPHLSRSVILGNDGHSDKLLKMGLSERACLV